MDSIAHYRILERAGEGLLGEVFRARDTKLGRTVAIKVPPQSIQENAARRNAFLADARTAMALSHPAIAAVYEAGDDNGRVFLACEFVPGDPLDRMIAGHPLNARRAIDIAAQIADALAEAHASGHAHGNLTPAAVIVTPKGAAKVLDMAMARWTRPDGNAGDEAADIRELRRMFFEMLTGRPPGADRVAPTSINRSLPAEVDAVALKDYDLAVTFAADLRAIAAILEVRAEKADKARGSAMPGRRSSSAGPWVATALAVAAALLAAAWWWIRK